MLVIIMTYIYIYVYYYCMPYHDRYYSKRCSSLSARVLTYVIMVYYQSAAVSIHGGTCEAAKR